MPRLTQFLAATAAWLVAALCGVLAAWLAWNHPLSPALALVLCAAAAAATALWPMHWPLWVLPALPLLGLAPWTGWVVVEEYDLLVLSVAFGGHLRLALGAQRTHGPGHALHGAWMWLLPPLMVLLLALWHGLDNLGDHSLGWWQGLREPLNAVRVGKSLVEVLLLLPLARVIWQTDQVQATQRCVAAMVWLLLLTGLGALWDRVTLAGGAASGAITGAAAAQPVSTLFWEMQLGGAAQDAVLLLGLPFAACALAAAGSAWRAVPAALALVLGVLGLAGGPSLLAVPAGLAALALWWLLHRRQVRAQAGAVAGHRGIVLGAGVLLLLASAWLAPATGAAGPLGLLGAVALMLPLQGLRSRLPAGPLALSLVAGAALALLLGWLAWTLPAAAGGIYALAWATALAMLGWVWVRGHPLGVLLAVLATQAALGGVVAMAVLTGGAQAALVAAAVAVLLGLAFAATALRQRPSWPDDLGWQAKALVGLAALSVAGAWLGALPRGLEQAASAWEERSAHWQAAVQELQTPLDWMIGKGLGSHPWRQAAADPARQSGELRWVPDADGGEAMLRSGPPPAAGQPLPDQMAQRVASPQPAAAPGAPVATLRLLARSADVGAGLQASLCGSRCVSARAMLDPARPADQWQPLQLRLAGPLPTDGPWWAPRPVVFALGALPAQGQARAELQVDQISLIDGQGMELLANGGFEEGLARWTAVASPPWTSWHLQNAAVHLLYEQGLMGLLAWSAAFAVALWRLAASAVRQRSLAPPLAAALCGVALLGLQDSLFDLPRAAFLGICLLAVALGIGDHRQHRRRHLGDSRQQQPTGPRA